MKREIVIAAVLSMLSGGGAFALERPNIIMILTDNQGFGDFGFTGNPYLNTPNMDDLFARGTFFSNFHVSSVSAPTRAALMTGRYGYRTGVTGVNRGKVNMFEDEVTLAEYLQEAGYSTALFGKWHLGYNYPMRPTEQGFEIYSSWDELQHFRTDPVMEESGRNKQYKGEFLTDVIFDNTLKYLDAKSDATSPFFIYLPTFLPHCHPDGLQVPEEYSSRFDKYQELEWHTKQVYAMIEKVDEQLGRLLTRLDELGLRENTLIIFGTDNGAAESYYGVERSSQKRYNAALRGMKGSVYEGGIRTPWCFMWDGKIAPKYESTRFSAHVDVLPTILDVVGVAPSKNRKLDGNSLYPILLGEGAEQIPDTRYYYHLRYPDMKILENEWNNSCYVEDGYKLVDGRELYNLNIDRSEQSDLAKQMPDKLAYLRSRCAAYLREMVAERGLKSQPNIVGSPKQEMVNLMYFEILPEQRGWSVDVIKKSKYDVTIHDIQHGDIATGASFVLEALDKRWERLIDKDCSSLTFEDVELPKGEYYLKLYIKGDEFPKSFKRWTPRQGRYHATEFGHRLVTIFDTKGRTKKEDYLISTRDLYDGLLD